MDLCSKTDYIHPTLKVVYNCKKLNKVFLLSENEVSDKQRYLFNSLNNINPGLKWLYFAFKHVTIDFRNDSMLILTRIYSTHIGINLCVFFFARMFNRGQVIQFVESFNSFIELKAKPIELKNCFCMICHHTLCNVFIYFWNIH